MENNVVIRLNMIMMCGATFIRVGSEMGRQSALTVFLKGIEDFML